MLVFGNFYKSGLLGLSECNDLVFSLKEVYENEHLVI